MKQVGIRGNEEFTKLNYSEKLDKYHNINRQSKILTNVTHEFRTFEKNVLGTDNITNSNVL